ncbi:hypothetical protein C2869_21205 [Saccharobesus litoralis]|uniref:Uncharacterized protein n=1 Tax=Saccharobesus litoralis TaxID=2172099 RepID=A0A2S0VX29_9ALTE|nr:hypothetical protein [Saccharobesus litoralis]AWB68759.1 hypothetical protein C2869_21205 [Saccharobesus litoralis]
MLMTTARELYYLIIESVRVVEAADELESIESLVVDFMTSVQNKEQGSLARCEIVIQSDEGMVIDSLSVGQLDADTAVSSDVKVEYGIVKFVFEFTGATEFDEEIQAVLQDWLNGEAFYPPTADLERAYKILKHINQPGFVCDRLGGVYYEADLEDWLTQADFVAFGQHFPSLSCDSFESLEINQIVKGKALKVGSLYIVSDLSDIKPLETTTADVVQTSAF